MTEKSKDVDKSGDITPHFWLYKQLEELTQAEWEALCDGCGRCCLQKFQDPKTGKVSYTCVACYLLDIDACRCRDYENRHQLVKGCLVLSPETVRKSKWLPDSCAYRRLAGEKSLAWWHPLVSENSDSVHGAGISVRNRAMSEELVHPDDLEYYIYQDRWQDAL